MNDLTSLKLFATPSHPCSYLDGEQATTVFIDPDAHIDRAIYSQLSDMGFRRSGAHLYRPQCQSCQACISVRVLANEFNANRSSRRCLKKNSDLTTHWIDSIDSDEHYQLYERYISERHRDGDMYPASKEQYLSFLAADWPERGYIEFRLNGKLISVAATDRLDQGLSAIYTFFDPDYDNRSLGKLAILKQIEFTQDRELPYLYLGYWVKQCQKMSYKTDYRPLELLIEGRWLRLEA